MLLLLEARAACREISQKDVQLCFEECHGLLFRFCSHQDAGCILAVLGRRLAYFSEFDFPIYQQRAAHVEFEQYRQFYSQTYVLDAKTAGKCNIAI